MDIECLNKEFTLNKCNSYYSDGKWLKKLFYLSSEEGKYVAELESGSYSFKDFGVNAKSFIAKISDFFNVTNRQNAEKAGINKVNCPPITVILVRDVEFPLIYQMKNLI